MRVTDIIIKKRNGMELSEKEIEYFIKNYTAGKIPDYQAAALMMAIYFKGMSLAETADLTMAMVKSGETVDLSSIKGVKVDKHSTGGVGDTTTLIAGPLAAACGIKVAKMSGRGLGHTGGTLDKLESIPGFKVSLSMDDFTKAVKKKGLAVVGQTADLVPADKLLYALRDVTGTVDSLPLIASSIMSKKIAAGSDAIVLDVKTGSGAFMHSVDESFALAEVMVEIGKRLGRKTTAIVTNMDQPLGMAVGNALEVWEAIEVLKDILKGPLRDVSVLLAAFMIYTGGTCSTLDEARKKALDALESGQGLLKLREMIRMQHGDERVIDDIALLPVAHNVIPVKSEQEGYITAMDAEAVGKSALLLGAGRAVKEDDIDYGVGLIMHKRIGEWVQKGDTLADFYVNYEEGYLEAVDIFQKAMVIGQDKPIIRPLVLGTVTENGVDRTPILSC